MSFGGWWWWCRCDCAAHPPRTPLNRWLGKELNSPPCDFANSHLITLCRSVQFNIEPSTALIDTKLHLPCSILQIGFQYCDCKSITELNVHLLKLLTPESSWSIVPLPPPPPTSLMGGVTVIGKCISAPNRFLNQLTAQTQNINRTNSNTFSRLRQRPN